VANQLTANGDSSGWTSEPSPVNADEARAADQAFEDAASAGQGPSATNDTKLTHSVVSGSESKQ